MLKVGGSMHFVLPLLLLEALNLVIDVTVGVVGELCIELAAFLLERLNGCGEIDLRLEELLALNLIQLLGRVTIRCNYSVPTGVLEGLSPSASLT